MRRVSNQEVRTILYNDSLNPDVQLILNQTNILINNNYLYVLDEAMLLAPVKNGWLHGQVVHIFDDLGEFAVNNHYHKEITKTYITGVPVSYHYSVVNGDRRVDYHPIYLRLGQNPSFSELKEWFRQQRSNRLN